MNNTTEDCSCDPYSKTSDCCVSCCTPFFSVFLVLEGIVLLVLVVFYTTVELKSRKKSLLWRIIFSAGITASLAKVLRLGMLANPATRHKSHLLLLFFLNTHYCFGIIGFLSLLFFWARLRHDLVMPANKGIYGKLLPVLLLLYYMQLPIEVAFKGKGALLTSFKILGACIGLISALAYVVYAILLHTTVKSKRDTHALFYRIYISAFVTAIFLIIASLVVFVTKIYSRDTVNDFLIRHSIYELCYLAELVAMPSGFIVHFIKTKSYERSAPGLRSMTHPMVGIMMQPASPTTTTVTFNDPSEPNNPNEPDEPNDITNNQ